MLILNSIFRRVLAFKTIKNTTLKGLSHEIEFKYLLYMDRNE